MAVEREALEAVNEASAFNRAQGFVLGRLEDGFAELMLHARAAALNHAQTLHAGVVAGMLDTVAGYAAATTAGAVVTVGLHVSYLSALPGPVRYRAEASVSRAGKRQVFVDARLFGGEDERLVATAAVILAPLG